MKNLFLNYNAHTATVTVNTYRNNGYFNEDVVGLIEDIAVGVHSCCNLEGAIDAVRSDDWAGTNATTEILEMIDAAICAYSHKSKLNLNDLKIDFVEHCLNYGFFFVVFENGKSVQCCLVSHEVYDDVGYSHSEYKAAIKEDNNGFSEGVSRDCNRWAAVDDEWDHINEFLIDQARKAGLEII